MWCTANKPTTWTSWKSYKDRSGNRHNTKQNNQLGYAILSVHSEFLPLLFLCSLDALLEVLRIIEIHNVHDEKIWQKMREKTRCSVMRQFLLQHLDNVEPVGGTSLLSLRLIFFKRTNKACERSSTTVAVQRNLYFRLLIVSCKDCSRKKNP